MPSKEQPDIDDAVLEEGCYHLLKLGLTSEQIAQHFEITPPRVKQLASSHAAKLASGAVVGDPFDAVFWQDVKKEAEGDTKVTFISEKGVHHAWKSDLGKLNGPSLLAIFEATKDFLNADPNQRFLDFKPPAGYDPLAMEREMKKSLEIISSLLSDEWEKRSGSTTPSD